MITHIGFFWTDEANKEAAPSIIEAARELLTNIPGTRNFRAGDSLVSARGAVDDSYQFAICMDFEDEASLQGYITHENHQRFITEYVKKYATRMVIYDIVS